MTYKKEYLYAIVPFVSILLIGVGIYWSKRITVDHSLFDSPDLPGSGKCMNKKLLRMLVQLERESRLPIFEWINSGARSAYWNAKVGGVSSSSHLIPGCKAVDIHTPKGDQKRMVMAAKKVGFKRIGIGSTFIHLDVDEAKTQFVAWGYPSGVRPSFNPFSQTLTA